jgi:hypothetical protein
LYELSGRHRIFIGFKMDSSLRRQLRSLEGPDRRYVSEDDTTFLALCRLDGDDYVGKLIEERLTTDRVDDVRRNVLSILQRLCPETRLPTRFEIIACEPDGLASVEPRPAGGEPLP